MKDREIINYDEMRDLEKQASVLVKDLMSPLDQTQASDSIGNQGKGKLEYVDPFTGRKIVYRRQNASEAMPAANIRSKGGQILPYKTKPPGNLIRFKR